MSAITRIAILGPTPLGLSMARRAYAAGYDVRVGTDPCDHSERASAAGFPLFGYQDAIAGAHAVILTLTWPSAAGVARELAPSLARVTMIIDCTAPPRHAVLLPLSWQTAAETIAQAMAPVPVVRALTHGDTEESDAVRPAAVAVCCGGTRRARLAAAALLRRFGLSAVAAGNLDNARQFERAGGVLEKVAGAMAKVRPSLPSYS